MDRQAISVKVIEIAAEEGGVSPAEVTAATHFVNDLEYDSLDVTEFAMKVEDELNVTIPDDQVDKLHTVGDVIDYVTAHQPVENAT